VKKYIRKIVFVITFIEISFSLFAQTRISPDSTRNISTFDVSASYINPQYPFINYGRNFIEWYQCDAISHFFDKLNNSETQKVKVLHIGDSHVQTDYYTGLLRNKLQSVFGYGGRGFIFPYKSAGTHSAYDYITQSSGIWQFSRNIQRTPLFDMGIAGATIHTADTNASFSIRFRSSYNSIQPNFRKLRIYCQTNRNSFGITLQLNNDTNKMAIPVFVLPQIGYVDVELPVYPDSIKVSFYRTDTIQTQFECSGLDLESIDESGIVYSSVGINGAGYKSILKQHLFESQLQNYQPDLVVIDVGANDFYPNSYNELELANNLQQIIAIIKKAAPQTSILLTNSHDLWRKKKNVPWTEPFSNFTRKMAEKHGCAFYDYYRVSGGKMALLQWRKQGLAQPDKVHLTYAGYQFKSELVCNALLTSYREYQEKAPDRLVVGTFLADTSEFEEQPSDSILDKIPVSKPISMVSQTPKSPNLLYHIVVKGESLAQIAAKYSITNEEILAWNKLKTKKIFTGQKLRIAPPLKSAQNNLSQNITTKKPSISLYHTVKKGETLFSIAKKYNTSVVKIKQLNRLKKEIIKPGLKLKIRE